MRIFPLFNFRSMLSNQLPSLKDVLGDLSQPEREPIKFRVKKTKDDVTPKMKRARREARQERHHEKIKQVGQKMVSESKQKLQEEKMYIINADTGGPPTCEDCWAMHGDIVGEDYLPPFHDHCDCTYDLV